MHCGTASLFCLLSSIALTKILWSVSLVTSSSFYLGNGWIGYGFESNVLSYPYDITLKTLTTTEPHLQEHMIPTSYSPCDYDDDTVYSEFGEANTLSPTANAILYSWHSFPFFYIFFKLLPCSISSLKPSLEGLAVRCIHDIFSVIMEH